MSNKQRVDSIIRNAGDGIGIKVQPRDSVDHSEIANNARVNLGLFPKDCWVTKGKVNNEVAWIVSAGPSLDRLLSNGFLRAEWFKANSVNKLFTVKHALPTLTKHGIAPHFCVVLDPRPIQGISTHGYVRQTLYSHAPKNTKFLVASMTHPSVTSWLYKNGYEVFGWHSAANGLTVSKAQLEQGVPPGPLQHITSFIQGGTCSATRSISLVHYLGFRKCNLIGFDSSLPGPPDDVNSADTIEGVKVKKHWEVAIGDSKKFWTTGELIAQLQDLQAFISDENADIEINFLGCDKGTSLVGALAETVVNKTHLKHYSTLTGEWKID